MRGLFAALACVLATVLAGLPVVNDMCGLGCDLAPTTAATPGVQIAGSTASGLHGATVDMTESTAAREAAGPVCPLHSAPSTVPVRSSRPSSDGCGHNHSIGRVGLVPAASKAGSAHPASLLLSVVATQPSLRALASDRCPGTGTRQPFLGSRRSPVLRI